MKTKCFFNIVVIENEYCIILFSFMDIVDMKQESLFQKQMLEYEAQAILKLSVFIAFMPESQLQFHYF
jgi:hypothetical protein